MDRLTCISAFIATVEAGSLAAASEVLGVTAPMVGRQVRWLEEHLGAQLLARTTRRQSLTEAGRAFYEKSKAVLGALEQAEEAIADLGGVPRGLLRINAPVTLGAHMLAPLVAEYLVLHPGVSVDLTHDNRTIDLVEEGYDAVVRVGELQDSGLMAVALGHYQLVTCASPRYLAAREMPAVPEDLLRHACLRFRRAGRDEPWRFRGHAGVVQEVRVTGRISSDNGQALRELAVAGAGVICQPMALVRDDLAGGRLVPVLPDRWLDGAPVHIVHSMRRPLPLKLRTFVDFLVARWIGQLPQVP